MTASLPDVPPVLLRWCGSACVATYLARSGLKKKSLSPSGAVAAFGVGLLSCGSGVRFGGTLLAFYYSSSKLTKYKADVKRKLDDEFKEGGQRDASQVLSCSAPAVAVAIAYAVSGRDPNAQVNFAGDAFGSLLLCSYLGFFACCCGDTWASELGVLDPAPQPRLVLPPFRYVPKGTNGGVSSVGTAASLAGGVFIGFVFWALARGANRNQLPPLLALGAAGGLGGSVLDSLMGATLQASYWREDVQRVVSHQYKGEAEHIVGYELLSNHGVNLWSATLTGLGVAMLGRTFL